jgi:negative regulator of sigma-B (phosphoserine phosphatase)
LFDACHEALRKTRGAVMSLASLDTRSATVDWCGIGNVEGALLRAQPGGGRKSEAITTRGGVVGYRMPNIKVSTLPLHPRDVFILATDGIRSGFVGEVDLDSDPQAIADRVFARYRTNSDDALVLVARYLGEQS